MPTLRKPDSLDLGSVEERSTVAAFDGGERCSGAHPQWLVIIARRVPAYVRFLPGFAARPGTVIGSTFTGRFSATDRVIASSVAALAIFCSSVNM